MSAWPSHSARHFLRELVVNAILLPCLDLIADPDTINHLLILAFDAQKAEDEEVSQLANSSKDVNFLMNFTEPPSQTVPDSLLQLKLSELLRDARQFSMFRLYLQDTRGPVHELSFLAEASRIHDSMQRKSYQVVYQRMQADHVIPFCQSDAFLGYLCGSPPVSVNELIDQRSVPRKSSVSGGTFSLAQFR
ncbi:hypothetical protein COOONC_10463 [Cooperia oncophora]